MIDSIFLSKSLTERFGLDVHATVKESFNTNGINDGQKIIIEPAGIESTISFKVELTLGWRTLSAVFRPADYASILLKKMNKSNQEQKTAFSVFAGSLRSKGAVIDLVINNESFEATDSKSWPDNWSEITITMKKTGLVLEKKTEYDFSEAFPWTTGFFGMTLALLPLEEIPCSEDTGEIEGDQFFERAKRYERSRINRAACIEVNGDSCKICGFSFGKNYGEHGEGFIHVHHIIPVSQMGGSYSLNPATDLIPVCPNCHSMLHRRQEVLLPEGLKNIITA